MATHEAGHAVVALRLGFGLALVTISPAVIARMDRELVASGEPLPDSFWEFKAEGRTGVKRSSSDRQDRSRVEDYLVVLLSGCLSDSRQRGGGPSGLKSARAKAGNDYALAMSLLAGLGLRPEERTSAVERLEARSEELVAEPGVWAAIEAVAAALLSTRTLSGEDVRRIAASAARQEA